MGVLSFLDRRPPVEAREVPLNELRASGARSHSFEFTGTDGVTHQAEVTISERPASDRDDRLRDDWYDAWLEYGMSDGTPYSGHVSVQASNVQRVGWTRIIMADSAALEDGILSFAETMGIIGSGWRARLEMERSPSRGGLSV